MALTPDISHSAKLTDYDLIENVDLIPSLPIESVDQLDKPALKVGATEVYAQDNIHCPWYR